MDKKIGSLFLVITFFSLSLFGIKQPNIRIEMKDKNHQIIDEAQMGIPFIIEVVCENFKPKSEIQGLENQENSTVQFAGSTQVMNYVNGSALKEEYIFKYIVVIKDKGVFNLGPISAQDDNGKTISSEKKEIVVGDIGQAQYTGNEPYILDVICSADTVYVGQKLKIDLNFCYRTSFEDLAIENTLFDDVEIGYQDKNWKTSKKIIEQKEYPCKQMSIEIFPKKAGTLIIPSFKASFISAQHPNNAIFGFFGFSHSKIIESHPKQVQVIALPESQHYKNVQAIGRFKSAKLTIDPKKGQIGEGIHAKMIIQGDGNVDILHHPELELAPGIHVYEGNSSIERIDDLITQKTFDWILQADDAGNFVIEPQNFVYFDPIDKKYKTLSTNSVTMVIEGIRKQDVVEKDIEPEVIEDKKQEQVDQTGIPNPEKKIEYYSSQKFYHNKSFDLLTTLIWFFVGVILVLFVGLLCLPYIRKIFFVETLQYRWLFWKYSKSGDIQAIYALFEKLAADYGFGLQSEKLHQAFLKNNFSDESFENWKNFLHMLLEFNFASEKSFQDKELVLNLAKQWFSIILLSCKTLRGT